MDDQTVLAANDPIQPEVTVELNGETFRLHLDFAALATTKAALRKIGIEVNLLRSLNFGELDVDSLPVLFFAAIQRFHPKVAWEHVQSLMSLENVNKLFIAIAAAYAAAVPPPKAAADPTPAVQTA